MTCALPGKPGRAPLALALAAVLVAGTATPAVAQDDVRRPSALAPVETGIAAFVGVVPADPGEQPSRGRAVSRPIQFGDWASFVSRFGEVTRPPVRWSDEDAVAQRHLQEAVRGFFANGGRRLWILAVPTAGDLTDPADELRSLENLDVDVVAIPGATGRGQQEALIAHAETVGDRIALLDGVADPGRASAAAVRATPRNSSRAVAVFPWLRIRHPDRRRIVAQPPSGHVAGVVARNDRESGVHRAPANLPVMGTEGLERTLSSAEVGALAVDGILVLRPLSGGPRTWGARTLGGDANGQFRYLPVRRTLDAVSEAIRDQLVPSACADAVGAVESYLDDMWRAGALQGAKRDEAYFTRCERYSDVLRFGLALMRPAEFVVATLDLNPSH